MTAKKPVGITKSNYEQVHSVERVIRQVSADLTYKAQILRELCELPEMNSTKSDFSLCSPFGCHHRLRLKEILLYTVEELEKTKAAFKSKQLEVLRKNLCKILSEI